MDLLRMRWSWTVLAAMIGCAGGEDVDPMVGTWEVTEVVIDEDTLAFPYDDGSSTLMWELTLTAEPRGRFRETDIAPGATHEVTYELLVDVFATGRWILENEDPSLDFVLDCEADELTMRCAGGFDGGSGHTMDLLRRSMIEGG